MRNRKVKGSQQLWRRLPRKINTFVIKLIRPSTAIFGMPYMFCVSKLKGSTCIVFQIIANYILVLFVQRTKIKVTKHYLIPFNNKGYRKKWNFLFCPLLTFVLFIAVFLFFLFLFFFLHFSIHTHSRPQCSCIRQRDYRKGLGWFVMLFIWLQGNSLGESLFTFLPH